jgi:hypothetical protein
MKPKIALELKKELLWDFIPAAKQKGQRSFVELLFDFREWDFRFEVSSGYVGHQTFKGELKYASPFGVYLKLEKTIPNFDKLYAETRSEETIFTLQLVRIKTSNYAQEILKVVELKSTWKYEITEPDLKNLNEAADDILQTLRAT